MKRLGVPAALSLVLLVVAASAPAGAQGRVVRLDGLVQWIAGDKMVMILDNGPSVAIDLTRVPQDQYRALVQRERVAVIGVVSSDNRRVVATAILRGDYGGDYGSQAP